MIISLYGALLAILFVLLSLRVIRVRRKLQVGLGDAGDSELLRAISVHANFIENVPLALVLILLVELEGPAAWFVHLLCGLLLVGRVLHAYGVSQPKEDYRFRVTGMVLTFTTILTSAAYLLYQFYLHGFPNT